MPSGRPRMSHSHNFVSWPFQEAVNTAVFTTRQILEGRQPVVEVYHDHDGDWQFLCGTTLERVDIRLVCMGCLFERDPTLAALADLPTGWCATRANLQGEWRREAFEDEDEEDGAEDGGQAF